VDSYNNLTLKSMFMLKFASNVDRLDVLVPI
jgi:hypothetical protein